MIKCPRLALCQRWWAFTMRDSFGNFPHVVWPVLRVPKSTVGESADIFSNVTMGMRWHDRKTLPIGPDNARGPAVEPSRCSSKCLKGTSFPCSKQTSHCNRFPNSTLISRMSVTLSAGWVETGYWSCSKETFLLCSYWKSSTSNDYRRTHTLPQTRIEQNFKGEVTTCCRS